MNKLSPQMWFFDGFALDLTRGCLLRGTQEVKLPPKPFEALKYLVTNAGRLISKAEFIQTLWPDTAVTDDSLVQCLMEVRRALGDDSQQVIKTVPRRGYLFDTPVSSSPIALTTYTEENGVQLIIEEGEDISSFQTPATATIAFHANESSISQRIGTAINRHRFAVVMCVLGLAAALAGIFTVTRPGEAIDSVAVMPFVNVNGDPNSEYLAEGISENIIDRLSHVSNLKKVIALSSVLRYKGKQTDAQTIGRELSVRAVLMGRITQHGDDVSITTELVDVRDNKRLWGDQYNRKLADMMTVQAAIAQEISQNLRLRLSGGETKRLAVSYTQNGEAYQLYMMGRYYFHSSRKKADLQKSLDYYEQAIKKDPNYAPAYSAMGTTYHLMGWQGILPPKESWQKEEWASLKALQLDNTLAEAHVLQAAIKEFHLDWQGAEEEYKRALELDPNSVRAHETYAWHLEMFERLDEALAHLKRAQELDPFSMALMWDVGIWFNFSRQHDQAIEQFQRMIALDPNYPAAHAPGLAEAYQAKGMYERAIDEVKKAIALGRPDGEGALAYSYAVAGKKEEAQKILDELKVNAKERYVSPFTFALIYMGLDDKNQAFEWFNKTFEENPYRIAFIKVSPRFDRLRSDPRFDALLRRMKLVT